jgi:hypothetical protein
MKYVVNFFRFWYDFVVGDDWTIAVFVLIAVGVTAAGAQAGRTAWPILPVAVIGALAWSLMREARRKTTPLGT